MRKQIVFLCGAHDFHAMDWYKSAKKLMPEAGIFIVTDMIVGEGFKKIISPNDNLHKLFIIDDYLFKKQSLLGHKWRNLLKLLLLPIQAFLLALFDRKNPNTIYHAHSMYYLVLARLASVDYIGTPQGSEILVRPYKSIYYKLFSKFGLRGAKHITVDSVSMQTGVEDLVDRKAFIIQNGIDMQSVNNAIINYSNDKLSEKRNGLLSIRGFTKLYRINDFLQNRKLNKIDIPTSLIYPFFDEGYLKDSKIYLKENDIDYGRVDRDFMYKLMLKTELVISIPRSDSSPRSVYEAIFCGAPVAITYNSYYDLLPDCMKSRIIVVNLDDEEWLPKALKLAENISSKPFKPTNESLEIFDQIKSFEKLGKLLFQE